MKNSAGENRIHFIGAGGISISALIKWCLSLGITVTGSDKVFGDVLTELNELGAEVYVGHNPEVACRADLVVYSSAVSEFDPELSAARRAGVPSMERHAFLGALSGAFDEVIAVSGTHGKTTVTSMISAIFKNDGKSFTAHVGGEAPDLGGNFFSCGHDTLVTEACEYKKSFLSLHPTCEVILNIESDHPDCYDSLSALYDGFREFVGKAQKKAFIVLFDKIEYSDLHIPANAQLIKFGLNEGSDYRAVNIIERKGICEYDILCRGKYYAHVKPNAYGRHNVQNALAAVAVADAYGVDKKTVVSSLENFKGVKRRFERVADVNGAQIISDYAHHPSEIRAVIDAAKGIAQGEVRVYFQPHTFSRTAKYFDEFVSCFSRADEVGFLPTYPARETPKDGKTSFDLFYAVNEKKEASYFNNFVDAAASVIKSARPGDAILVLGAGDIVEMIKLL